MEYVRLKDIGQIITGNTPPTSKPEYYGDYMPFIKATDIPIGVKCTLVTEQSYSKLAAEKYKKSLVPKGSTCVVTIGSIGKKMTYAHTDLFVNQAINAIVPKDSYDNEYIFYNVRCSVLPQLKKLDSGTTSGRENISKTSFSSIRIPVIRDKNVQRRIGVILSTYDSLIENNTKRIRLLEKMAENLYKEWFVRFRFPGHEKVEMENGLPKGWTVEKVKDWCRVFTGRKDVNQTKEDGQYVFFSCSPKTFHSDEFIYDGKANLVAGNGSYTGRTRFFEGKFDLYQRTYAVVSNKEDDSFMFYLYLRFKFDFEPMHSGGTRGSAIPYIVMKDLTKYKFLYKEDIVEEYIKKVKPMFAEIDNLQQQNILLARQRDLLLPRLMSGKLEV